MKIAVILGTKQKSLTKIAIRFAKLGSLLTMVKQGEGL